MAEAHGVGMASVENVFLFLRDFDRAVDWYGRLSRLNAGVIAPLHRQGPTRRLAQRRQPERDVLRLTRMRAAGHHAG